MPSRDQSQKTNEFFACPRCGAVSYNPNDIKEGYCGRCHWWTGHPTLGPLKPKED